MAFEDVSASFPSAIHKGRFAGAQEAEKQQTAELDAARQEARQASKAFDNVRQQRHNAFTAAFDYISGHIDGIFKVHSLGAVTFVNILQFPAGQFQNIPCSPVLTSWMIRKSKAT